MTSIGRSMARRDSSARGGYRRRSRVATPAFSSCVNAGRTSGYRSSASKPLRSPPGSRRSPGRVLGGHVDARADEFEGVLDRSVAGRARPERTEERQRGDPEPVRPPQPEPRFSSTRVSTDVEDDGADSGCGSRRGGFTHGRRAYGARSGERAPGNVPREPGGRWLFSLQIL